MGHPPDDFVMRFSVVPPGLGSFFARPTPDLRPGLNYVAAPRLGSLSISVDGAVVQFGLRIGPLKREILHYA